MKTRLRLPLFTFLLTLLCLGFSSEGWGQTNPEPHSLGLFDFAFSGFDNGDITEYPTSMQGWRFGAEPGNTFVGLPTGDRVLENNGANAGSGNIKNEIDNGLSLLNSGSNHIGSIVVSLNTLSRENVSVSWIAEDIRTGATRTSGLKLQYRIGTTGDFTEVSGTTYLSNPSGTQPEEEFLDITLPAEVNNEFEVQVRWLYFNESGSGSRDRIRLDDIFISSEPMSGPPTPFLFASPLSLSDLNYNEFNGPSASQTFELSGVNLDGISDVDVVLPALSDFEISTDDEFFFDSLNFPAYDGTATNIYVRLKAGLAINTYTDDITISGGGADPVSVSLSGQVQPVPVLGWQIDDTNIAFVLDFDNTAIGANEGQYDGSGFEPLPATGRLNSNAFATAGMSEGDTDFGDDAISGDFARGTSSGGVTTGGFYAFEVAPGNHAFGWQATGSDFAPGTITLRLQNQTGQEVTSIDVSYLIYQYNNDGRSSAINFSYSEAFNFYEEVPELDFISTEAASGSPVWEVFPRNTRIIPFEPIPEGEFFFLRWETDDVSGSGSRDELALDNIRVIFNEETQNYVYEAGSWTPENPSGNTTEFDIVEVRDGEATIDQETNLLDIYIAPGATLRVEESIVVNGNILSNGNLIFVSNATTTGQLDAFDGIISGEVEVQRYIPARRAFRLLSSAVTTTTNINFNWQEGVNNPNTSTNLNPNPGFGTHITGSTDGSNGFDATPSGNPSLFNFNNTAQSWEAVENTDINTIAAGTAVRLFVRGDRSIDVTSNSAEATNTTLRTTGTLHTGPLTVNSLSEVENDFNFVGNPYPAAVDMNELLAASDNINTAYYIIWDPTLNGTNGRGAFVTIDLPLGTNSTGSAGDRYLQPGQAAFVATLANGAASIQFEEEQKNVFAPLTTVFNISSQMDVRLYRAAAYAAGETPSDGLRLKFGTDNTNAITSLDAPKFYNLDENLATSNDDRLWSIESRFTPQLGEVLPLFTNQYRTTDYVFEAELNNITGVTAYLRDTFTGEDVLLNNDDATIYAFTIDAGNPDSSANDRFEIVFSEEVLGTNDNVFGNGFVLYPNPVQNDNFFIATRGMEGQNVTVEIHSMLGQLLVSETPEVAANGRIAVAVPQLPAGVFIVTLTAKDGSQFTTKLINR